MDEGGGMRERRSQATLLVPVHINHRQATHYHHHFQVMYITATFPYVVTTVFLVQSVMLDGAMSGIQYMFTPNVRASHKSREGS